MKKQSAKRRYKAANDSKIYFNWHWQIYIRAILTVVTGKKNGANDRNRQDGRSPSQSRSEVCGNHL